MKTYVNAEIEVIELDSADVIVTSNGFKTEEITFI